MKIGLCQYNPTWENVEINKKKIHNLLEQKPDNTDLLIFPELTLTGFTMQPNKFAESREGSTYSFFKEIAIEHSSEVIYGQVLGDDGNCFNMLVHLDKQGMPLNHYLKIHPFSYGSENLHYAKGSSPITSISNNYSVGYGICYDLRFPEMFRIYGKNRVDIIVVIANWPVTRIKHWYALLKARAIENQCFVIGVNRTGNDPKLEYSGFSAIFDPMGEEKICLDFSNERERETMAVKEIDISEAQKVRNTFPFLQDIRLI